MRGSVLLSQKGNGGTGLLSLKVPNVAKRASIGHW